MGESLVRLGYEIWGIRYALKVPYVMHINGWFILVFHELRDPVPKQHEAAS